MFVKNFPLKFWELEQPGVASKAMQAGKIGITSNIILRLDVGLCPPFHLIWEITVFRKVKKQAMY